MTEKKRKALYWTFKALSILISCALPFWAICEKFPLWTTTYGETRSIGVGAIIALIVAIIVFRKAVFAFIRDKFNLTHAPPLVVWLVLIVISYILIYLAQFMKDLTTVLWMGFIGCAIGTALTYVCENIFGIKKEEVKKETDDGNIG